MKFRIGYGYDVHQLAKGEELWLGGLLLESDLGAVGHSDADVLIHVICDAILGAANMRDIGFHFPDTDPKFKGIDSKKLLSHVMKLVRAKGYELGNVDVTVVAEQPKINPHIERMQECLGQVMSVKADQISIKATTSEKIGFAGRREGIAAHAVALLEY